MNKARILITGGAGFIGSHLADHLLDMGYSVVVLDNLVNGSLDNLKEAFGNKRFEFRKGDVLNLSDCKNAIHECDYVFHLACLGVRHSIHSPLENHKVNAEGTLNVLEASRGVGVKQFFYISTSEVYGKTDSFPISEDASTNPLTVYGASKLAGENYTHAYKTCYGLNTTVFRIFNNYGPRAHYEGDSGEIIPRSIVRILHNQRPVIFGDGLITRDFFYVKDTAKALACFIGNNLVNGLTLNIGTGREVTLRSLLDNILQLMNKDELGIEYLANRPADVPRLWVNAERFYKMTNFVPSLSFQEGLKVTISYYEEKMKKNGLRNEIVLENWKK